MRYGILGPLEVARSDGSVVTIAGPARRLLLAALLARAGASVSATALIEDLWGPIPPRTAAKTLQSHVARLRDDLGRDEAARVFTTDASGYRLAPTTDDFDVTAFLALLARARGGVEPREALATYDQALALWRGEPYADFLEAPFAVVERVRLTEERILAEEERTDVALGLGQAAELVAGLEKRLVETPYRERGWEQLMLALYRAGRQADALATYRRVSSLLAEDLGIDPGPALADLHARILRQDESLRAPLSRPVVAVPADGRCPYVGLAAYDQSTTELFVGRERLTASLVSRLADHAVVVVAGASGAGKSSVLRAGLIPALRSGALPGSASWKVAVRTPVHLTDDPSQSDLLVVDQAEELFTTLDGAARASVAAVLSRFVQRDGRVVLAIRGDFYARLTDVAPLGAYAEEATLLVPPLRPDEARRVVTEPAGRVGLQCEPALVDAVLDELGDQIGALPLLSAALVGTWENREDDTLTLAGYRRAGGIAAAVERAAEEVYAALSDRARVAVRRVLVRLAEPEGDAWVRRSVRRSDLLEDDATRAALDAFAAARLLTLSAERVEVTHEALFTAWPRLHDWLREHSRVVGMLEHLHAAARDWNAAGRPESDLYRGTRLQTTVDWLDEHPDEATPLEAEFVRAAAAVGQRDLAEARSRADREARGRRGLRRLAIGLSTALVLVAAASGIALRERSRAAQEASSADRAALVADVRRLATLSANAPDLATASLLAVAANRLLDDPETRGALLAAVDRSTAARWRVQAAHTPVALAVTPDGSRLVYSDDRRMVTVLDTATRRSVAHFPSLAARVIGISPDASQVITFGQSTADTEAVGRLAVVDVSTGKRVQVLTTAVPVGRADPVISPDGRWVAAVLSTRAGRDLAVWDSHDWSEPPRRLAMTTGPNGLAVSDGAVAYEGTDGAVEVRALPGLRALGRLPAVPGADPSRPSAALAVSTDGHRVVRSDPIEPQRLIDFRLPSGRALALPTQPDAVDALAFAPGDAELAVGSASGSLAVYRAGDGGVVANLPGDVGGVSGLAWSGGGAGAAQLFTTGYQGDVVAWSVDTHAALVHETGPVLPLPDRGEVFGHWIVGLTPGFGTVRSSRMRWFRTDLDTGRTESWPAGLLDNNDGIITDGEYANQISASADARTGLIAVNDQTGLNHIDVWDLARHRRLGRLRIPGTFYRHFFPGLDATVSADGRTAYAAVDRDHLGVFALPSGRLRRTMRIDFRSPTSSRTYVRPLRLDPGGRLLVAGVDTGPYPAGHPNLLNLPGNPTAPPHQMLGVVDLAGGRLVAQADTGDNHGVAADAWSPDARRLVVGTVDGTLLLFDATSLHLIDNAGTVEPGAVGSVSFTSDGGIVVEAGAGATVNLFAAADLSRVGSRLPAGDASAGGLLAWAHGGEIVGYAPVARPGGAGGVRRFAVRVDQHTLVTMACELAGGELTRAEWRRDVGDLPYRRVCPA